MSTRPVWAIRISLLAMVIFIASSAARLYRTTRPQGSVEISFLGYTTNGEYVWFLLTNGSRYTITCAFGSREFESDWGQAARPLVLGEYLYSPC